MRRSEAMIFAVKSARFLALAIGFGVWLVASGALAQGPSAQPESEGVIGNWKRAHAVSASFDIGKAASTYGMGYAHLWRDDPVWFGAGSRLLLFTRSHQTVDAGGGALFGKFGVFEGSPVGLELALGWAGGSGQQAMFGSAGGFLSLLVVELGYAYGFPMPSASRPGWLATHQFALRINVPVSTSD